MVLLFGVGVGVGGVRRASATRTLVARSVRLGLSTPDLGLEAAAAGPG